MSNSLYPDRLKLQQQYTEQLPHYNVTLEAFQAKLKEALSVLTVHFGVKYRVKEFPSYYGKLLKRVTDEKKTGEQLPIHDILGTRVVCPFLEDVNHVESCLRKAFNVHEVEYKGAQHTFREFGYSSTHLVVEIPREILQSCPRLKLKFAEVQIRTFLQDAWAEVEHELIYKNNNQITPLDEPLRRKLAALNANLSLSDIIFQEIREYQRQLHGELDKRRHSFVNLLEEHKPGLTVTAAKGKKYIRISSQRGMGVSADNMDEMLLEALCAHNEKDFPEAVNIYSKILEQDVAPNIKTIVLIHKGVANFSQSNFNEALTNFQEAVICEPKNSRALYYLGIVNRVLNNNAEALKALQTCVEINPFHVEALFALGRLYFEIGDYPGALEYCEKTLMVEPESALAQEFRELVISRMKL
ncbi:MAG: tetratricopeptide repeat protein [Chitinispirillales bacterium]|jgi:putative GTP pyrophosphokinase|nr:tetratricopeptide repeat protein [Chitinispirillales bacterium]